MFNTVLLVVLNGPYLSNALDGLYSHEDFDFNAGYGSWILPQQSWQRETLKTLSAQYQEVLNSNSSLARNNTFLVPFLPGTQNVENIALSTMSRDIVLVGGGMLEILFSIYLFGWDFGEDQSPENSQSSNPKLQVFYDEEMVFEMKKAVLDNKQSYDFNSWNQFKMFSEYQEAINITVTVVGCRGTPAKPGSNLTSLVLLDNIHIKTTKYNQSIENEGTGRVEPVAELNENNGTWLHLKTEAQEESQSEENQPGKPLFCFLLPESVACGRTPKIRYFFNSTSDTCETFVYEGCGANENRFEDLHSCQNVCAYKTYMEPNRLNRRKSEFSSFENGFDGWNVRNWKKVLYSSNEMKQMLLSPPPVLQPNLTINNIGVCPEYHTFDFRQPELTQEFIENNSSLLIIEFQLLLKGEGGGILSLFFNLDPGFEIYVGNIKVFDFTTHGVKDEHWHEYRIKMNRSEVEEHRIEAGHQNILITIKGWLGSGGNGNVVLDNLNVTQTADLGDSSHPSSLDIVHDLSDKSTAEPFLMSVTSSSSSMTTSTTTKSETPSSTSTTSKETTVINETNKTGLNEVNMTDLNARTVEDCTLMYDPGTCNTYQTKYYFDNETSSCYKFSYGGCKGNMNRFESKTECSDFCAVLSPQPSNSLPLMRPAESGNVNSSVCGLPSEPGDCKGAIVRYYYSPFFENCFSFHWTGCGGNDNNFKSWSSCWMVCQPQEEDEQTGKADIKKKFSIEESTTAKMKDILKDEDTSEEQDKFSLVPLLVDAPRLPAEVCKLNYEAGPCAPSDPTKFLLRYFFNSHSNRCEKFLYGGCGGNHNNFYNASDCLSFCQEEPEPNPKLTGLTQTFNQSGCFISPRHGFCNAQVIRWYYSRWDNVCKPYNYTGCGGNNNKFNSFNECTKSCPPVKNLGNGGRCSRLRDRGSCETATTRFFFDTYSNRCIRFSACPGPAIAENNFASHQDCASICLHNRSEEFVNFFNLTAQPATLANENVGWSAESVVEALLIIIILGLTCFAGLLGYRLYRANQGVDSYRLFNSQPANQQDGRVGGNGDGGGRVDCGGGNGLGIFNNPIFNINDNTRSPDLDRHIQIPALTLGDLGVIQEESSVDSPRLVH